MTKSPMGGAHQSSEERTEPSLDAPRTHRDNQFVRRYLEARHAYASSPRYDDAAEEESSPHKRERRWDRTRLERGGSKRA